MHDLLFPSLNLFILLGFLIYYLRAPVKSFIQLRHKNIETEFTQVESMLKDAEIYYSSSVSKLGQLQKEIVGVRSELLNETNIIKNIILKEAKKASESIMADARLNSERMLQELKQELYSEMGKQVVARAESILKDRMTGEDRKRIRDEFSSFLRNGESLNANKSAMENTREVR